jgi:hypothetical protein
MNTTTIRRLDSDHVPLNHANIRLSKNRQIPPSSNEGRPSLPSTPFFNLQLFDDSDEFESGDIDKKMKTNERRGANSTKQSQDDEESLVHIPSKSQSLDNLSTNSSVTMRKSIDVRRDVTTRRHALDPGAVKNLQSYVRRRKNSIAQRVIGYNYDDHSTAGGLYIRVGIGSNVKLMKRNFIDRIIFSFLFGHGYSFWFVNLK